MENAIQKSRSKMQCCYWISGSNRCAIKGFFNEGQPFCHHHGQQKTLTSLMYDCTKKMLPIFIIRKIENYIGEENKKMALKIKKGEAVEKSKSKLNIRDDQIIFKYFSITRATNSHQLESKSLL